MGARPSPRPTSSGWPRPGGPTGCGPSCCSASAGPAPGARTSATGAAELPVERPAPLTLALVLRQGALAEPDGVRGDLDELVLGDELEGGLERQRPRRRQSQRLVVGVGPDVGELLLLRRVDVH